MAALPIDSSTIEEAAAIGTESVLIQTSILQQVIDRPYVEPILVGFEG